MQRLLWSKVQGYKDFWKSSNFCHVGISWIALAEYSQISTQGFNNFSVVVFCIILYWLNKPQACNDDYIFLLAASLKRMNVQEAFVLCSRGELNKYRVPWLLHEYTGAEITVRHYPFPDGHIPNISNLAKMLEEIKVNLTKNTKTILQWVLYQQWQGWRNWSVFTL